MCVCVCAALPGSVSCVLSFSVVLGRDVGQGLGVLH